MHKNGELTEVQGLWFMSAVETHILYERMRVFKVMDRDVTWRVEISLVQWNGLLTVSLLVHFEFV